MTRIVETIPCTACGDSMFLVNGGPIEFKESEEGEMQPYHPHCVKPPIVCPECERELHEDAIKCPTCTAGDN